MSFFRKRKCEEMVSCTTCHGEGITLVNNFVRLSGVCERCGGDGELDWVTNAMNRIQMKENPEAVQKALMANIQFLQNLMVEEGYKAGIQITVNIGFKNMNEYLTRPAAPMMIKGGR